MRTGKRSNVSSQVWLVWESCTWVVRAIDMSRRRVAETRAPIFGLFGGRLLSDDCSPISWPGVGGGGTFAYIMVWLHRIPPMMSALAFGYGVGMAAPDAAIDGARSAVGNAYDAASRPAPAAVAPGYQTHGYPPVGYGYPPPPPAVSYTHLTLPTIYSV